MSRRRRTLLGVLAFALIVGAGVGGWFGYRAWRAAALRERVVGQWDGSGTLTTVMTMRVGEGPGIPGGKASSRLRLTTAVQAEFRSDGTYTWHERLTGDGLTLTLWWPKEGEPPTAWEVVRVRGDTVTVRIHVGEVDFVFRDRDTFVMHVPETVEGSGTVTFARAGTNR